MSSFDYESCCLTNIEILRYLVGATILLVNINYLDDMTDSEEIEILTSNGDTITITCGECYSLYVELNSR